MLSGGPPTAETAMAPPMDDYLAKPFDREELHRLLEKWCIGLVASRGGVSWSRCRPRTQDITPPPIYPGS
jgi:hypothetical protein